MNSKQFLYWRSCFEREMEKSVVQVAYFAGTGILRDVFSWDYTACPDFKYIIKGV